MLAYMGQSLLRDSIALLGAEAAKEARLHAMAPG